MSLLAGLGVQLAAWLLVLSPAQTTPQAPPGAGVRAVLGRRTPVDERTQVQIAGALAALGSEAVPLLYGLVTGRELDAFIGEEWRPAEWVCLPEEIPGLCARALERAGTSAVVHEIERALDGEPTFQERLVVLRILAAQGSSEGLELVLRVAGELGELELGRPSVRLALRTALSAILAHDRNSWKRIERGLDGLEPTTAEVLVEAIGEAERPQGMALLARFIQRGEPAPEGVAEAMARLERARPWELAGRTMGHFSVWLRSPDPLRRAHAARLAGSLHALASAPALLELLSDADELVRRCAVNALVGMAGSSQGSSPTQWEAWFEREQAWKEGRWEALLEELVSAPAGPANEALRELMAHALYRHEVGEVLAGELLELPPAVAMAACAELERLDSRWALPGLVRALDGAPPQLCAAAWRALRGLTGQDHELSVELWRQLIDS